MKKYWLEIVQVVSVRADSPEEAKKRYYQDEYEEEYAAIEKIEEVAQDE